MRTDNGERLRIQIIAVQAFLPYPKLSEMVANQWIKIGIQADVRELERNLAMTRVRNNEHHIYIWNNGGTELLYLFPRHAIPVDPTEAYMGPDYATYYASGGTQGTKPDDPNILKMWDLFSEAASLKVEGRNKNAQEIWKILADQQIGIGTVGQSPAGLGVRLVSATGWATSPRACATRSIAAPPGTRIPRPGTSRPDPCWPILPAGCCWLSSPCGRSRW